MARKDPRPLGAGASGLAETAVLRGDSRAAKAHSRQQSRLPGQEADVQDPLNRTAPADEIETGLAALDGETGQGVQPRKAETESVLMSSPEVPRPEGRGSQQSRPSRMSQQAEQRDGRRRTGEPAEVGQEQRRAARNSSQLEGKVAQTPNSGAGARLAESREPASQGQG